MSREPIRTCISCRGKFFKSELVRFTWVGAEPVPDPDQKAKGRGAYSCKKKRCLEKIYTDRKKWQRSFRLS